MSEFYYDSYAIIAYLNQSQNYVDYFIPSQGVTSFYNVLEVYYSVLREQGADDAKKVLSSLRPILVDPTFEDLEYAMHFKLKHKSKKLSYVDCLGYALARRLGILFLTGDEGFKGISGVEFVKE